VAFIGQELRALDRLPRCQLNFRLIHRGKSANAKITTLFARCGTGNNVDSTLHPGDGLVETIKVIQVGNISLNARNVAADCLYGLVELLLAAARDEDIRTFFGEQLCRSQSNPFGAAGDDCYFPPQRLTFAHRLLHSLPQLAFPPGLKKRLRFPEQRGALIVEV
jgi:hypothetical protein